MRSAMEHLCSKSGDPVEFFCPKCQVADCHKCISEDHMLVKGCSSMIRLTQVKKKSVREAVQLQIGLAMSNLNFAGVEDSQLSRMEEKYQKIGETGRSVERNLKDLTSMCQLLMEKCQSCEDTGDGLSQQCRDQAQKLKEFVKPGDQYTTEDLVNLQVENGKFASCKFALFTNPPHLDRDVIKRLLDTISRLERDVQQNESDPDPVGNEIPPVPVAVRLVKGEFDDGHSYRVASGTPSDTSVVDNLRNFLAEGDGTNPTLSPTMQEEPTEDEEEESLADSTETEAPPKRSPKRRVPQHNSGADVSPRKSSRNVGKTMPNYFKMVNNESDEEESDDESDVELPCGQANRSGKRPPNGSPRATRSSIRTRADRGRRGQHSTQH